MYVLHTSACARLTLAVGPEYVRLVEVVIVNAHAAGGHGFDRTMSTHEDNYY